MVAAITVWRQLKDTYQKYERRQKRASSSSGGLLIADSTGVKTGKTKRGSPLNLAIKVTGREVRGKRAVLKKELVTLSVGKWREDELRGVQADLGITDGEPELKGVMARTQPDFPLSAASSTRRGISTGRSTGMERMGNRHTGRTG